MGTASTTKLLIQNSGIITQKTALTTSAGAGDAQNIPALNASGVLDPTIVNAVTSSAGAGSSGQIPALNAAGRLDTTFMPVGVGADTVSLTASEALSAGAFVNIWNNSGTANVRNADGSTTGKWAHGFVLAAVSSSASGTVYLSGLNTSVTGATVGPVYLSTTPGSSTSTAPSSSGQTLQLLGVATSATSIQFTPGVPIYL